MSNCEASLMIDSIFSIFSNAFQFVPNPDLSQTKKQSFFDVFLFPLSKRQHCKDLKARYLVQWNHLVFRNSNSKVESDAKLFLISRITLP